MGNTIKNYERKKRGNQRKASKELRGVLHDALIDMMYIPNELKRKEKEIFNILN